MSSSTGQSAEHQTAYNLLQQHQHQQQLHHHHHQQQQQQQSSSSSSSSSSSGHMNGSLPLPLQLPLPPSSYNAITAEQMASMAASQYFPPFGHPPTSWMHPALAMYNMNATSIAKFQWRKGKWTEEEEMYTKKLIDAFNSGCLKIASGTTLRSFLAERLFCDPMRITKKFAGSSCIGKQVFIPRDGPVDDKELAEIQDGLKVLEKTFMSKIDCQHRQQSYQMAGLAGSQGAVIAAALQSQASAAMGLSMPSPYMNSTMDGTGMGLSSSNHGGNYPPELLAAFHPHHAATMSMPLPMHPMLAGTGGIHGLPGGPSLAGYPNMYYAFPPPSHAHHPQQQPSMGSRKGSRKGSSSSDSSDSGPDANSAYHMAMHANEAAIREMKANLPTTNGTSRQLSNHSNLMMNNSSSSSSSSHGMSAGGGGGGAPIYRSRQSYTSAELFGQQYPTTLEHMAFLSSENLEASRKKRSSDGSNILSGGSQLHVQVGQKHNSHPKGSSSSKGKKGSTGRVIPADPIDLDASSLLLNFFQSTTTIPEENKSDTSNGTSSHEVTFASGSKNEHEHDGEGGGGDIHDEHKKKKAKMGGSSKSTTADENEQPTTTTTTGTEHISHVVPDKQEAPSTSTSDGKLNGSRGKYKSSTSSGSGRTSNGSGTGSGDGDNDDSASTFSDAGDADASNSISGRSSSLSSDRSDNSDYSSPDEKEQKNQQRNRIDYEEKPKPVSSSVEVDLESRSRMVQEGGDNMNETTEPQPQQ